MSLYKVFSGPAAFLFLTCLQPHHDRPGVGQAEPEEQRVDHHAGTGKWEVFCHADNFKNIFPTTIVLPIPGFDRPMTLMAASLNIILVVSGCLRKKPPSLSHLYPHGFRCPWFTNVFKQGFIRFILSLPSKSAGVVVATRGKSG